MPFLRVDSWPGAAGRRVEVWELGRAIESGQDAPLAPALLRCPPCRGILLPDEYETDDYEPCRAGQTGPGVLARLHARRAFGRSGETATGSREVPL